MARAEPTPQRAGETLPEDSGVGLVDARTGPRASEPELPCGALFAERYHVERLLGRGGMGTVYAALDTTDGDRPVALKVLRAALAGRASMVTRFEREAQMLAAISSEHVVRLVGFGLESQGGPYLVLERLEGEDLGRILSANGPLSVGAALRYVRQAALGVGEAHAAGLVHRDVKPSNLFLAERAGARPTIKVVDFGIARPEEASDTALTSTGEALGSPRYMSPEQVRNAKAVDARTDVWSLGVTLYELLTGALPFEGTSAPAVAASIVADPPIPLRRRLPTVTESVERVVDRCLAKDPNARFRNAVELAAALEEALDVEEAGPPRPRERSKPTSRSMRISFAVAATLALGLAAWGLWAASVDTTATPSRDAAVAGQATSTPETAVVAQPSEPKTASPQARTEPPPPRPEPSASAAVTSKLPARRATTIVGPMGGPLDDRK